MKQFISYALVGLGAQQALGHATFQQLWINGVDFISVPSKPILAYSLTFSERRPMRPCSVIQLSRDKRGIQRHPLQRRQSYSECEVCHSSRVYRHC
jgi:hypothetical protein